MVKQLKGKVLTAILALVSGNVSAATVSVDDGTVMMSTGGGFGAIAGEIQAAPGTLLMVQPGGRAHITYSADCIVYIGPGEVRAVDDSIPCGRAANAGETATGPSDSLILLGGGLVLAGGLGLAVGLSGHGSPASP